MRVLTIRDTRLTGAFFLFFFASTFLWSQSPGTRGRSATIHTMAAQRPGHLGVGVAEVTPERAKALKLAEATGVEVKYVVDNSAASKAGLKPDDVILELNRQKIEGQNQFGRSISETAPGTKITLTIWREGSRRTVTATLDAAPNTAFFNADPDGAITPFPPFPPFEIMPNPAPMIGIDGESLTPQLAQFFGVQVGVLVRTVDPRSPADKAGLKAGDVIVKVNGTPVTSPREISGLLRVGHKPLVFTVVRNHKEITLNLELALEFDPWLNGGRERDCEPNGLYLALLRVP